ncbi:MAG TPA: type II toxin-antitoxin system VapC family toxin [Candidatus Binatia bacterium]|nr:type II toxin-antitoxin system VapC family toxin [Candidatus Binatia bacterium]
MILADTSVWIDHLRHGDPDLRHLLNSRQIAIHPFVIAELALGTLRDRTKTLALLELLPQLLVAQTGEVRAMIENRRLYGLGLGLIDVHLIASALLNPPTLLWTRDKALRKIALALRIHANLL